MSGGAEAACAFAMAQVGDPYLWGGNGPDRWDCSGLTVASYKAAGVSLPRTAALQWAALPHVPLSQLQRGDLVFQGVAPAIHHVVLYLGNGMVVDAPHSGAKVRTESLSGFRDSVCGGRPAAFGTSTTPTTAQNVGLPGGLSPWDLVPGIPPGLGPIVGGAVGGAAGEAASAAAGVVEKALSDAVSSVWGGFQQAAIKYGAVGAGLALVGLGLYRTVQARPTAGES